MGKMGRQGGLISLLSCAASRLHEFIRKSPASLLALVYPCLSLGLDGFQKDSFLTAERISGCDRDGKPLGPLKAMCTCRL